MTWQVSASGTQTAVIGTESVLATDTTNATYYFEVNVAALANGDVLELRIYNVTLSGGASLLTWKSTYGPIPPINDVAASPSQPSDQSIRVTLKQTVGTGRSFPWKLLRI
jgi:hypothetical protein